MNDISSTELAVVPERSLALAEIKSHVQTIQRVLADVMIAGTHYGKPFDSRPKEGETADDERRKLMLLKPGAELLCMTFRIAPQFDIEEMREGDAIRYRIRCRGVHQVTGQMLGEGLGECSTAEEKYHWRKAICKEEFDDADVVGARRKRYRRGKGGTHFVELQIAEQTADKANTVLKMAVKRALVAMILHVTAASDMFMQPEDDDTEPTAEPVARKTPRRKEEAPAPKTPEQSREDAKAWVLTRFEQAKLPLQPALDKLGIKDFSALSSAEFKLLKEYASQADIPF